jgi:hypothetical protein
MLARLICFLLGHLLEDLVVRDGPESYVYVGDGKCSRCGAQAIELREDDDDEPPTPRWIA